MTWKSRTKSTGAGCEKDMRPSGEETLIAIDEQGPEKFSLTVTFGGRHYDCGVYINRFAAIKAGKLFIARKEGEAQGRAKRARKKV